MSSTRDFELFIGTYAPSAEDGIYQAQLNGETGELTVYSSQSGIENPSFLAIERDRSMLYAVSEQFDGKVAAYKLQQPNQAALALSDAATLGDSPCHLVVDESHQLLYVANYGGGNIVVYSIDPDGNPSEVVRNIKHEGRSIRDDRQDKPHPHSVNLDPNHEFLFVPDLGLDEIIVYRIEDILDHHEAPLQPHDRVKVKPGAGPRHFAFHPSGKYACVINELDSTIVLYAYHAELGKLEEMQTISTLPEQYASESYCAHLQFSNCGERLYASNRGHDSIAVYSFDSQQGRLELVQLQSTDGSNPRHFSLSPDGRFLLAANQGSNSIVTFRIDASGLLQATGFQLSLPRPVCIVWR